MRNSIVVLSLFVSGSAFALKQAEHQKISVAACLNAGLPDQFCQRVGDEAYDVDAYEWNDLSAHAQIDDGQSACDAANAAQERLRKLGATVRGLLPDVGSSSPAPTAVAVALGRALHTIQDNCAHHGMPNPQHAWWSLSDSCKSTSLSPDIQPQAITCARVETDKVFAIFNSAMQQAGVGPDAFTAVESGATHWPARGEVCHFIKTLSQTWDGSDGRWENSVVTPALRGQLEQAMTIDDSSLGDVCQGGDVAIWNPAGNVDTSNGQRVCLSISSYCLGKADATDAPPPWETEDPIPPQAAGCSTIPARNASPVALFALLGLTAIIARRRSR